MEDKKNCRSHIFSCYVSNPNFDVLDRFKRYIESEDKKIHDGVFEAIRMYLDSKDERGEDEFQK